MIKRKLEDKIVNFLFKRKIIIIYGPRQAGKTTLAKKILNDYNGSKKYYQADIPVDRNVWKDVNPFKIKASIGDAKLVIIDEAQQIENIGTILKTFFDNFPEIQIIATGSSSFDLANKITEPLTGRALEFTLYPISFEELNFQNIILNSEKIQKINETFLYGFYPEIFNLEEESKKRVLAQIQNSALYKDILTIENIKKPKVLEHLSILLANYIGNDLSLLGLARELNTTTKTVERYITILEKMFIVIRLYAYSKNLSNELKKNFKLYFVDIGLRNSILNDFKDMNFRSDNGVIFENYFIMERIKLLNNNELRANKYFWRDYENREVDYIEEIDGDLFGYECKYKNRGSKGLKVFEENYKPKVINVVTFENFETFLK